MSGWSLDEMDDMVWDEFQESNDHIVPDPEDVQESTWTVNGKQWKKPYHQISSVAAKNSEQKTLGYTDFISGGRRAVLSGSSSKEEPNMDMWGVLQDEELVSTSFNPMHVDAAMGIGSGKEGVNSDCCKDGKLESDANDLIIGLCKEHPLLEDRDATAVSSSCHFLLSDICSPDGDLDLFGGKDKDETSNNLLDYSWANIDDFEEVDNLFRESTLPEVIESNADELIWPSSSFASAHKSSPSIVQQEIASSSLDTQAPRAKSSQFEVKTECVPCDSGPPPVLDQKNDLKVKDIQQNDYISISKKSLEHESARHILTSGPHVRSDGKPLWEEQLLDYSGKSEETTGSRSKGPKEHTGITSPYTNKVNAHLLQTGSSKQLEEYDMKKLSDTNATHSPNALSYSKGQQFAPSKLQVSSSSALQVFPSLVHASQKALGETNSTRQVCPQVPYTHAGYGYPLHHMPVMHSSSNLRPEIKKSQQVFGAYQHPEDASNQRQNIKRPFKMVMTPQDKIEKLRWRQQMQGRLAIDHKLHLFDQNLYMDQSLLCKHPQKMHCRHTAEKPQEGAGIISQTSGGEPDLQDKSSVGPGLALDDEDCSLEATVLHQLQILVNQLDIRTRLCIGDALYRLARSATQRRNIADTQATSVNSGEQFATGQMNSSISDYPIQADRCTGITILETETNIIDRSVAHLLFHKCPMPSAGELLNVAAGSSELTSFTSAQNLSGPPNSCLWVSPAFQASTWPGTNPMAQMMAPVPEQFLRSAPESHIETGNQNIAAMKGGSTPSASGNASSVIFHSRVSGALPSGNLLYTRGIEPISKYKGVPQNDDSSDVKCNPLDQMSVILADGKGLPSQSVIGRETAQPNSGNQAKQESLDSMEVDVCNTDADVMMSEQSSDVGDRKELQASFVDTENIDHKACQISPSARTMLVH